MRKALLLVLFAASLCAQRPGAGVALTAGQIGYGNGTSITSNANLTRQGVVIAAPPVVVALGPAGAPTWCYQVVGFFGNARFTAPSTAACVTGTIAGLNNSITAPSAHDGIVGYVAYLTTAGAGGHVGLVDYPDPDATIFDTSGVWAEPLPPTNGITEGIILGTPDRVNNGNLVVYGQLHAQGLLTGVLADSLSANDPNIINNFNIVDLGLNNVDGQGAILTNILFGYGPEGPMTNVAGLVNMDVNVGDSSVTAGVGPPVILGERIRAQAENPASSVTLVAGLETDVVVAGPVSGTATGVRGTADNSANASAMTGKLFALDAPTVDPGLGATAGAALIHGGTIAANPTGTRYGLWIEDPTAMNSVGSWLRIVPHTLAEITTAGVPDGTMFTCSDCKVTTVTANVVSNATCTGSGGGATGVAIGGVLKCDYRP